MKTFIRSGAAALSLAVALTAGAAWSQKPATKPATKPAAAAKPAAPPASKFGALAVDRTNGFAFGFAYDHPSRSAANQYATEECRKRGGACAVVVEFSGEGCAAYETVSDRDGSAYGWGTAKTQVEAQSTASQQCSLYSDGKACMNHVWACNSKDVAPFKVLRNDPVKPKPAATDCLVQYELQVDTDDGDNWVTRLYSPAYRLSAADCPLASPSQYHGFYYKTWTDGRVDSGESNPPRKAPALQARGIKLAEQAFNWAAGRRPPISGAHFRTVGSVNVSTPTPDNIKAYIEQTGGWDAGDERHLGDGVCLGLAPPGVAPVETLGVGNCRRWVR